MPLPRQRQKGGDFPPFFHWLAQAKAGPWRALLLSVLAHGVLLALPSSHHGPRRPASPLAPSTLEVRLPREAPPADGPEITALNEAARSEPDAQPEKDNSPVERGGVVATGHYFDSSEVESKAEPVELAPLIYPEAAYLRRIPGVVKVRVYISASGAIDAVDIVSAEPPDMFEMAALDALLKTRFKPAQMFGRPVASVKLVSINFDPLQDHPSQ